LAQEKYHRSLPVTETYQLVDLQPNNVYFFWLAAKSKRGEGATTSAIAVRTDQYGKSHAATTSPAAHPPYRSNSSLPVLLLPINTIALISINSINKS